MVENNGLVYHCIKCGETWGSGRDVESHGICPDCFADWSRMRQREKGLKECFGEHKQLDNIDCGDCSRKVKCKEYYGIKHNLLR